MKKKAILGIFLLVFTIGFAKDLTLTLIGDHPCGSDCENSNSKCCSTKNGTVFYGSIKKN